MNIPRLLSQIEFLAEDRADFLTQRYGPKLADKLRAWINQFDPSPTPPGQDAEIIRMTGGIIRDVVNNVDPKRGGYSEWIIRCLVSMSKTDFEHLMGQWEEDCPKINRELALFDRFKARHGVKDIREFGSFRELAKFSRQTLEPMIAQKQADTVSEDEVEKVFDDGRYLILIPKTQRASCKYGANTRWCTASENNNYFDRYSKEGPLYIVIDRTLNDKWQFHFESKQFMDAEDDPIDIPDFLDLHPIPSKILAGLALKTENPDRERYLAASMLDLDAAVQSALSRPPVENPGYEWTGVSTIALALGMNHPEEYLQLAGSHSPLSFTGVGSKSVVRIRTGWDYGDLDALIDTQNSRTGWWSKALEHDASYDSGAVIGDTISLKAILGELHGESLAVVVAETRRHAEEYGLDLPWDTVTDGASFYELLELPEAGHLVEKVSDALNEPYDDAERDAFVSGAYNEAMEAVDSALQLFGSGSTNFRAYIEHGEDDKLIILFKTEKLLEKIRRWCTKEEADTRTSSIMADITWIAEEEGLTEPDSSNIDGSPDFEYFRQAIIERGFSLG